MSIRWWDEPAGVLHSLYTYEHGVRLPSEAFKPLPGTPAYRFVHEDHSAIVFGSREEQFAVGMDVRPGTDRARSALIVPMLVGERLLGAVVLENHDRDNAFGPAEQRLLETVAGGMAVALLNAKSYEAERQRAAELALINTVQRALAGELSLQGVYDSVGMKLREVFPDALVGIRRFDPQTGLMHFPFWPHRHPDDLAPAPPVGYGAEVLRTKRTLLVDHDAETRRDGWVRPRRPLTESWPDRSWWCRCSPATRWSACSTWSMSHGSTHSARRTCASSRRSPRA